MRRAEFVGVVGKRIEFEALVVGVYEVERFSSQTDIVKLRDGGGNLFTWFATGYTNLYRGDRISIKGTVKRYDIYRGVKQTILTRCKFHKFEILTADEAATKEVVA